MVIRITQSVWHRHSIMICSTFPISSVFNCVIFSISPTFREICDGILLRQRRRMFVQHFQDEKVEKKSQESKKQKLRSRVSMWQAKSLRRNSDKKCASIGENDMWVRCKCWNGICWLIDWLSIDESNLDSSHFLPQHNLRRQHRTDWSTPADPQTSQLIRFYKYFIENLLSNFVPFWNVQCARVGKFRPESF